MMRDVSPQLSLEARCHSLHEMATKDPLTQVANRAEFNRVHEMFVAAHLERQLPCSLIICDLDHFKSVNDTYGHPAGDEVLKTFAKLLKTSCRPGDLVARYGGEEFAMLCADCDNATAARRAEEIRRNWSQIPHAVCSSQVPDGQLRRDGGATGRHDLHDALAGRPRLVRRQGRRPQQGGAVGHRHRRGRGGHQRRRQGQVKAKKAPSQPGYLAEQHLVTLVPMGVAIEKLRGFVADHQAEIVSIEGSDVRLKLGQSGGLFFRRSSDRQVAVRRRPALRGRQAAARTASRWPTAQTRIHVTVTPQRNRDRRRADAEERARAAAGQLPRLSDGHGGPARERAAAAATGQDAAAALAEEEAASRRAECETASTSLQRERTPLSRIGLLADSIDSPDRWRTMEASWGAPHERRHSHALVP